MSRVAEVSTALKAAVGAVEGIRGYTDLGANVQPPAVVVGPPKLTWSAYDTDPTVAEFLVFVMVKFDDRSLERLWDLVPLVAAAIEQVQDAVVTEAVPGLYSAGTQDLPSYEITVQVGL